MFTTQIPALLPACIVFLSMTFSAHGQFTEVPAATQAMYNICDGAACWGDYDNDGDLDILLTGYISGANGVRSEVFRNDAGIFTSIQAGLQPVLYSTARWGDFDSDGDLDIFIAGRKGYAFSRIYRNVGGNFVDIQANVQDMDYASSDWGDYDNDGDLDLAVSGWAESTNDATELYRNDGIGFTLVNAGLVANQAGAVDWGDYDNDGDLDLAGSKLYRNDSGTFTAIQAAWPAANPGGIAWGDYDNDGDLDILLSSHAPRIFRNDAGSFTDILAGFPALSNGSAAWGDYDNDGDLDVLICGSLNQFSKITEVYRNDASSFTAINAGLLGLNGSEGIWGDYDNDGDLDILLHGWVGSNLYTKLYRNDASTPNTAPATVTGMQAAAVGDSAIRFTWSPGFDLETPTAGLSYRLWIGTVSTAFNISPPMADTATGWRRIATIGDIEDTTWTLHNIIPGETYFACVSAVDAGFRGGPCSVKTATMTTVGSTDMQPFVFTSGPNPTNGSILISCQVFPHHLISYSLTNSAGQAIPQMAGQFVNSLDLDLSSLASGLYMLSMTPSWSSETCILKIIKE
jgi:hypothetical protein